MALFLSPSAQSLRILWRQKPGETRNGKWMLPHPEYAQFISGQFYTEDPDCIAAIRNGPDVRDGKVIDVEKQLPGESKKEEVAALTRDDSDRLHLTCVFCGQVAKSAFGLQAHVRACKKRKATDELAPGGEQAVAGR